ncbi:hypothetical protein LOD99_5120 [Oopsacas minuta]|uniref:Uncharacterized protein n=1 Tax=Oopsacas minuta TaxID=111878 RepID=A0AAV7JR99_9METZ|nr:hypothetical protein LOD99_5120 [Oopsacas minuta]
MCFSRVSDSGIYSLSMQDYGRRVACGTLDGNLTLVELSDRLHTLQKNEKTLITAILEREMRREKILEGRNRELKLKEKMEKAAALRAEKAAATEEREEEENLVKKAEEDFWSTISTERNNLEKRRAKAKKQNVPTNNEGEKAAPVE